MDGRPHGNTRAIYFILYTEKLETYSYFCQEHVLEVTKNQAQLKENWVLLSKTQAKKEEKDHICHAAPEVLTDYFFSPMMLAYI